MKSSFAQPIKYLLLILLLVSTGILYASGGDAHDNRGLYGKENPDFPLNGYVNGKLGILSPEYRLSYLVVAYRYLSNHPLSSKEQQNVLDAFSRSVNFEIDTTVDANPTHQERVREMTYDETDSAEIHESLWWNNSKKFSPSERVSIVLNNYPKIMNPFTKFKFAAIRLKSIVDELDNKKIAQEKGDTLLKAWFTVQDAIFSKELSEDKLRELIREIPTDNLPLLKLDLDYMTAVTYFNSSNQQSQLTASQLFTELAANENYPWQEWAEYLNYRTLTRIAYPEIGTVNVTNHQQLSAKALAGMQFLAANAKDPAVKKAAIDYKDIILSRVDRRAVVVNLVNTMTEQITRTNFYKMIFFNNLDGTDFYKEEGNNSTFIWHEITEEQSELLYWIYHYRSRDTKTTFPIAYERWHKSPTNAAWFIIALNAINEATPAQQKELLSAATKITPEHPGFYTIRALLIKDILQLEGDTTSSKAKRRNLIANTFAQLQPGNDFSTHEYFAKRGIPLATNIHDLAKYGFFVPSAAMISFYEPIYETKYPYYSSMELSDALNYLPLSVLTRFIQLKEIPILPRRELYASVWARATMLGNYHVADRIAKRTGELNPNLKPYIQRSLKTKNSERRQEILVRALLYFPELTPIINLKNTWLPQFDNAFLYNGIEPRNIKYSHSTTYWCSGGEINRRIYDEDPASEFLKTPWVGMLTPAQQKQLNKEQAKLNALPSGPVWLLDKTYKMAKKYPRDQENAELLARAINLTRVIDCYTSDSIEARKAFYILKTFYANTEAAVRTHHHY